MTQQATVILLDAATHMSIKEQEDFSVYFSQLLAEHYHPKQIPVTGRVMEAILENFEEEQKKK